MQGAGALGDATNLPLSTGAVGPRRATPATDTLRGARWGEAGLIPERASDLSLTLALSPRDARCADPPLGCARERAAVAWPAQQPSAFAQEGIGKRG